MAGLVAAIEKIVSDIKQDPLRVLAEEMSLA
jgi:hypothetical protein